MGFVKIIAVDFDGCLCENSWPEIGDDNPEVIRALLEEQRNGAKIILWTCREGELLQAALDWCAKRGILFDCVNEPWPELKEQFGNDTRKIFATEYWDDRAVEMPMPHHLNRLARDIHENAVSHGWWEGERSFGEIVALCHSELSEALEEFRDEKPMAYGCCGYCEHDATCDYDHRDRTGCKPEGIAVEMIDCIIRILDWCGKEKIDVDELLHLKRDKGRPIKLGHDYELAQYIERKIAEERRSPAAVLMDMELEGVSFDTCICEKTIYNYVNGGVFLTITNKNLPERGERKREYKQIRPSRPPKGESIEHRPENINERVEPGHWEMDTVKGKQKSTKCVLVLTERVTRNEITLPMYGCTMENVVAALNMLENKYGDLFQHVFRSITVDNGSEFQDYDGMRTSLDGSERTKVYYCHPYSSYERGSNENLNKMFRRLFPKGTDFDYVDDDDIIAAADWMNNYPRKVLGRTTAARRFKELLPAV